MTRDVHHDVTVRNEPTPDDEGNGVQAILRAFMRNPVAAVEVIGFIGGLYGLYYTLTNKVESVQASSEQHYKDLSAQAVQASRDLQIQISSVAEKMQARMDVLQAADKAEVDDIRALYARGDQRYREIFQKLSEHDVTFGKVAVGVEYITRQLEQGGMIGPREKHSEFAPSSFQAPPVPFSYAGR